ncbi:unnamed protein product [Rotaria magnacalcarata]|uniref:Uncharacterized protein n=1 Tax=Rotaria magnacalcarata TaxID=392030 RepID=A0A816QNM3_9BILA|nr:unnamed protein product [Rotaria magnacalcarata]
MNQFNRSRNEKINNPQCNFKRKKKSTTTIENLSNEFFGKVFGYLDGCDIYILHLLILTIVFNKCSIPHWFYSKLTWIIGYQKKY